MHPRTPPRMAGARAASPAARRRAARSGRPPQARPAQWPARADACATAAVRGRPIPPTAVRKFGDKIRSRATEALHHSVRGERDKAVLARGDIREQFENGRICLLDVIHQHQLETFAFRGQEPGASWKIWRAVVMIPAGSKASGIRRSRTSRYFEYRAAAAIQSGRPHWWPSSSRSAGCPAGFDNPVKELPHLVTETARLQCRFQVRRPRRVRGLVSGGPPTAPE